MKQDLFVADYSNQQHADQILFLMDSYAQDPMGGGSGLTDFCKQNLVTTLAGYPTAFTVLCTVGGAPAGLINCFESISTFACKPLINIHDVTVAPEYRRQGVSTRMLEKVEEIARERDCCKLTLEVLEGNHGAKLSYERFGFSGYELDPEAGQAMFWDKKL